MCGIVGWISLERSGDAIDRRRFMEQALIIDTLRGDDSTGVFVVPHETPANTAPRWLKNITDGYGFVRTKEYQELYTHLQTQTFKYSVGHNRSATIGAISHAAAHPFQEGPITLVHNGTLNETHSLGKSQAALGAENDSHTICHNLATSSVDEVVAGLNGAFALVWHDARDDSLNMIRNIMRPMHIAKAKAHNTIYFMSEGEMLNALDKRINIGLDCIVALKPGFLLKFRAPDLMVPEVRELEFFQPPVSRTSAVHWPARGTNMMTSDGSTTSSIEHSRNLTQEYYASLRKDKKNFKPKKGLIPDQLQLELCDLDMDPEMEFNFVPMDAILIEWRKKTPCYTVLGRVLAPGNRVIWGMVHGIAPHTWEKAANRLWTVSPIGVWEQGWSHTGIIARIKTSIGKGGKLLDIMDQDRAIPFPKGNVNPMTNMYPIKPKGVSKSILDDSPFVDDSIASIGAHIASRLSAENSTAEEAGIDDPANAAAWDRANRDASAAVYPGPGHRSLDYTEWLDHVQDGCAGCGEDVRLAQAWNIKWVNADSGRAQPYCLICQNLEENPNAR